MIIFVWVDIVIVKPISIMLGNVQKFDVCFGGLLSVPKILILGI